jgi:ketosteroid isomerase-like protein
MAEPACHQGPQVEQLIAQRAAFNQAIRDGDAATIGDLLSEDVVLVLGIRLSGT